MNKRIELLIDLAKVSCLAIRRDHIIILDLKGNLDCICFNAVCANNLDGVFISNIIAPGLTGCNQPTIGDFPLPILDCKGFFV